MRKDNMKKIEELRTEIQENKFKMDNLEKEMGIDISYLVANSDTFLSLGIITEEDSQKLKSMEGKKIDHKDIETFKGILKSIEGIKERIDGTLIKLREQKLELAKQQGEV